MGNELLLICPRAPEKAPEGHILLTASRTRVARVASAASLAGNKRVVTWSVDESPGTAGADEAEAEEGEGEGGDVSSSESDEEGALPLAAAALQRGGEGIRARILHKSSVQFVAWHAKGDYVASVCPNAQGSAVTVHQITRRASHGMFRKVKGQVQRVLFHPTKPIFFVSTKTDVRVFHLVRKTLLKRLLSNVQWMSSLAVHPGGNHLVCGSFDGRCVLLRLRGCTRLRAHALMALTHPLPRLATTPRVRSRPLSLPPHCTALHALALALRLALLPQPKQ